MAGKGKLLKRMAKTTGTTVGEAKGIMRTARADVRAGKPAAARNVVRKALVGGKTAGVKRTPTRTAKARAASIKIVGRMERRNEGKGTRALPPPKRKSR